MARCILVLALCFAFAVPSVLSRRVTQQPQDAIEHSPPKSTIFVNGFNYITNEAALKKHFGVVGAIKDVRFNSRGAAVITYQEPHAATRAVNELHETSLEGQSRAVVVKMDDPDWAGRPSGRTIFVNGFDSETDDDTLKNHFGTVGAIEDYHFQSKRSAVIIYVKASAAQKAVTTLDGSAMNGQSRNVAVKLDEADPNDYERSA